MFIADMPILGCVCGGVGVGAIHVADYILICAFLPPQEGYDSDCINLSVCLFVCLC